MAEKTFNVTGMHCGECETKIEASIKAADSALTAKASWEAGTVSVTGVHCDQCEGTIKTAIEGAGDFKVA